MSTTYVQARDALVARIHAGWTTTYPSNRILYDNTVKADLNTLGDCFLRVEVDFTDAVQYDIDAEPSHEVYGELLLTVFTKEGTGTRTKLSMFDYMTALFKRVKLGGVQCGIPRPGRKRSDSGWVSEDLIVPFDFNSTY
jgi:hypothetical protein